jgi:hypothetical protein
MSYGKGVAQRVVKATQMRILWCRLSPGGPARNTKPLPVMVGGLYFELFLLAYLF